MIGKRFWSKAMVALASLGLLAACNIPDIEELNSPLTEQPTATDFSGIRVQGVTLSQPQLEACGDAGLSLLAQTSPPDLPVENVRLQYRFVAGDLPAKGSWHETRMELSDRAGQYEATLDSLGQEALDYLEDATSNVEYWIVVVDKRGEETVWPEGKEVFASFPVIACQGIAGPAETPQAQTFQVVDFGASPASIQYGGCAPTDVTFELSLEGHQLVDSIEVKTTWYAGGDLAESNDHPLEDQGPDPNNPGARRFATTLDFGLDANAQLEGGSGAIGWNIYVNPAEGETMEFPLGGPPTVAVSPCGEATGGDIAANPTATPTLGPIIVLPLITPTPTSLSLIPLPLFVSQGKIEEMKEGWYFDLDSAQIKTSSFSNADFEIYEGDDPYLDQFRPVNGSYVGWYGEDQPSKSDCTSTLKSASPMTIEWPEREGTYYCFETSEGRQARLKLIRWVSLPLSERHIAFEWATWQ